MAKKDGRHTKQRIKIARNIPVPPTGHKTRKATKSKYPFRLLTPGESFNFPGTPQNAHSLCAYYSKLLKRQFVARVTERGPRCWRVS